MAQQPQGGSAPAAALHRVFGYSPPPQAVYLIADGPLPPGTVDTVRELNATVRAVVHTAALADAGGRADLQQIAREGRGQFRFVTSTRE